VFGADLESSADILVPRRPTEAGTIHSLQHHHRVAFLVNGRERLSHRCLQSRHRADSGIAGLLSGSGQMIPGNLCAMPKCKEKIGSQSSRCFRSNDNSSTPNSWPISRRTAAASEQEHSCCFENSSATAAGVVHLAVEQSEVLIIQQMSSC
jgi:hypothetical protein